jgi:hypothetical protein
MSYINGSCYSFLANCVKKSISFQVMHLFGQ